MEKLIVLIAEQGKGNASNSLVLTVEDAKGKIRPIFVNSRFAEANGINEGFDGAILLTEEFCKAGDEYTDVNGEVKTFTKSFNKVTSIKPLGNSQHKALLMKMSWGIAMEEMEL